MPEELREKTLCIVPDESWRCIKYDACAFHKDGPRKIDHVGGVDFVMLNDKDFLFFIEAKDSTKEPTKKPEDLIKEIPKQVHDTVSGIIGASRSKLDGLWLDAAKILIDLQDKFVIIVCVEMAYPEGKEVAFLNMIKGKLEQKLSWLSCKVIVTNSAELGDFLPGTKVSRILPEAPN